MGRGRRVIMALREEMEDNGGKEMSDQEERSKMSHGGSLGRPCEAQTGKGEVRGRPF